jgi:hypothetical protein
MPVGIDTLVLSSDNINFKSFLLLLGGSSPFLMRDSVALLF